MSTIDRTIREHAQMYHELERAHATILIRIGARCFQNTVRTPNNEMCAIITSIYLIFK